MSSSDNKTEQPTAKRRGEAVEKGNVARSAELNSAMVLLTAVMTMRYGGATFWQTLQEYMGDVFRHISSTDVTADAMQLQFLELANIAVTVAGPILLCIAVASVTINLMQTGLIFASKALEPKFSKISPLSGFKRLFSSRSLVELLKGIVKISIVGTIGYLVLMGYRETYPMLAHRTVSEVIGFLFEVTFELSWKILIAVVVLAVMDLAYQRWEHERKLKMTKEEVKDEHKQSEGDPKVKGKMQSQMRELARTRMMAAVPAATVVVTNPVHLAIALKYEPASNSDAPVIVAMGQRKVAERIKQIARENGVPVIENKPLAQSLFANGEVNREIPIEHYQAVAEILSAIYRQGSGLYNREDL